MFRNKIRPYFMSIGFGSGILSDLVLFADRTNAEPKSNWSILWDICGEHAGTVVDPEVSRNRHACWGGFRLSSGFVRP